MPDATTIVGLLNVPGAFAGLPDACPGADTPIFPLVGNDADDAPKRGRPPKIPLTLDVLRDKLTEQGISIRWNLVTRHFDYDGIPESWNLNPETMLQDFPIVLHDKLKTEYSGTLENVTKLLSVIGGQSRYNPVLDYIAAEPWDGHDYFTDFVDILNIQDGLSCELIWNWLLQAVALLHNNPTRRYSPDGILVFQGEQGAGKTTAVRVLGMKAEWTLISGRLDGADKDTLIRLTSYFISELGELDGTFKRTDAARMKAFITCESDHFRRPYGTADTVQVRRTSLIGTVNEERFLVDPTGNRRFWVVPLDDVACEKLRQFNALGLWRQMLSLWREEDAKGRGGDCYRLTPEQRKALEERNSRFRVALRAEDEVADIFAEAEAEPQNFEWRNATVSDFKLLNASLSRYSVTAISKALDALGHEMKRVKINGKTERMRYLPCRNYS